MGWGKCLAGAREGVEMTISWCPKSRQRAVRPQLYWLLPPLVLVELLGLVVQGLSLSPSVHQAEAGDSELFAGLHNGTHPASRLLSLPHHLLGHHLAPLVDAEVILGEPSLGPLRGAPM